MLEKIIKKMKGREFFTVALSFSLHKSRDSNIFDKKRLLEMF